MLTIPQLVDHVLAEGQELAVIPGGEGHGGSYRFPDRMPTFAGSTLGGPGPSGPTTPTPGTPVTTGLAAPSIDDIIGDTPTPEPESGLSTAAAVTAVAGSLAQMVGTFFDLKGAKQELKQRRLSMEFEQSQAAANARQAEVEAQSILEVGQQDVAALTMRAGADAAARRATMAARGIRLGTGSAANIEASGELIKDIDVFTIQNNAAQAAAAARMRGANFQGASAIAGASARSLRGMGRSINPFLGASTSLLNSATRLAPRWYQ